MPVLMLILSSILFSGCGISFPKNVMPEAQKGVLDLRNWDFETDGPVALKGKMKVCLGEFKSSSIPGRCLSPEGSGYIKVPEYWSKNKINGRFLSAYGSALIRIEILFRNPPCRMAVKVKDVLTAFNLYANGVKIASNGKPGHTPETTTPGCLPLVAAFTPKGERLVLEMEVANFHYPKGGIFQPMLLGSEKDLRQIRENALLVDILLIGSIIFMAFYHLSQYYLRRDDPSFLYFYQFCILIALRTAVTGEACLIQMLPDFSWEYGRR